jgi:hypothetical protein
MKEWMNEIKATYFLPQRLYLVILVIGPSIYVVIFIYQLLKHFQLCNDVRV